MKPGGTRRGFVIMDHVRSFNPLPAMKPGGTIRAGIELAAFAVSIRSRR